MKAEFLKLLRRFRSKYGRLRLFIEYIKQWQESSTKSAPHVVLDQGTFQPIETRIRKSLAADLNPVSPSKQRVLLVTSNGAGLGHLTRVSAVSRWLDAEYFVYTMSSAYQKVGLPSNKVYYFPSYGDLGIRGSDWNPLMEHHFRSVVAAFNPDLILFDGTYVYRGITTVARASSTPLIWLQRGCWKTTVDDRSIQRHNAAKFSDRVIIPGDYGCREQVDCGVGIDPIYVDPVTIGEPDDMLDSINAREKLSLPQEKKLILVQLGAGVINDIKELRRQCVELIKSLGDEWQAVVVRNPLSPEPEEDGSLSVQAFPISHYFNAFDAGVFAGGYNSVQECIRFELPAIFVPNIQTKTDDQEYRVASLVKQGIGLGASDLFDLRRAFLHLADEAKRNEIKINMKRVKRESGAKQIAQLLDTWSRNSDELFCHSYID